MPIYEYTCQKCGAHLEVLQKISDKPLARHGKCGGRLTKEWSQTSFQLKGSGWYVTDYAGRKAEAGESKTESSAEAKPAETKAESKEAKAESKEAKPAPKESKKAKEPKASAAASGD